MKICFNKQIENTMKHPAMPDDAPFHVYEFEDENHPSIQELISQGYQSVFPLEFETYKASIDMTAYDLAMAPTEEDIRISKLVGAEEFGLNLIFEFKKENMDMGIVQAGKAKTVARFLHFVYHYVSDGNLYAAVDELDILISTGTPADLAPFVTAERLVTFSNKIRTYTRQPLI